MKLSEQVCTLEQSRRLRDLGITAPSTFWWGPVKNGPHGSSPQYGWTSEAIAPAYNVAELGVMLPEKMKMGRLDEYPLQYHRTDEPFGEDRPLWFSSPIINGLYGSPAHTTEAIMKADLLIYLIENKHITADEANKILESERTAPAPAPGEGV